MKKAILNGMTVLFAILLFSSCDALMEDALQDRDTTALETERDTYVTPDESTEEPTDPSTEIPTDELTEVSTEAPTEGITYADETVNQLVNQLRAEGFNMDQLTFSEDREGLFAYAITLNDRVFSSGDNLEILLPEALLYGEPAEIREYWEWGKLTIALVNYDGSYEVYATATTEDFSHFTIALPDGLSPGAYNVDLYLNDWSIVICPVIVCESTADTLEPLAFEDEDLNSLVNDLRADGHNMEQLTFHEEHTNYTYTATVSDRVFYPGEQIEIILTDLISYNDEVDLELFLELGQLQVMLNNYKGTFVIYEHAVTENGETFTLTVPSDMQSGVYSIELFLADWMLTVCPVVVCSAEEPTDSIPDETLPSLLDSFTLEENPKMFMLIVELEGADGCDMEQLTYRMAHKDGKTYSYTATLNHRVYQPGDTIEISFRDLVYQGKAVDVQEAIKSGLLKVSLSDYCMVGSPEENAFTWTEDGRAVLTVTRDMAPDTDDIPGYVYSVTVYVGEEAWFFSGIIIY